MHSRGFSYLAILATVAVAAMMPTAHAQQLAFDSTGAGLSSIVAGSGTYGYTFTTTTTLLVTELDVFHRTGSTFTSASMPVGIWDSVGTLRVTGVVDTSAPAITRASAGGQGEWFGVAVANAVLGPGSYSIGMFITDSEPVITSGGIASIAGATYGSIAILGGPSLTEPTPTSIDPGVALFGPSFIASAVVPEASAGLLALLAATGLACVIRRSGIATGQCGDKVQSVTAGRTR